MRKTVSTLLIAMSLVAAGASASAETILFSNSNGNTAAINLPGSSSSLATGVRGVTFTVDANAITLNQATFGMFGDAVGNAGVGLRLYAGSSASGTALETVSAFSVALTTIANGGTLVTFNTSGWSLTAGTTYTLAAYNDYGVVQDVTPRLGSSTESSGAWTSNGLAFNRFTAGSSAASDNYYVSLSGTIVPEPSTLVMGLAGIACAGWGTFRRRRAR